MSELDPQFLSEALYAYMSDFKIVQEVVRDSDDEEEDDAQRIRGTAHFLIGEEIPSMPGFAVRMHLPVRKLKALYEANVGTECPYVDMVDVFRAFMESKIASAAAFDLINASFAKDVMKQWANWKTDTVTIEDSRKELSTTEAGARVSSLLSRLADKGLIQLNAPPASTPGAAVDGDVIPGECDTVQCVATDEVAPLDLAKSIQRKRRN